MRISDWSSDVCSSDLIFVSDIALRERQFALFGEVVVPVGDKLKVTGGGRYFDARQRSSVRFGGVFADPNTGTSSFRNKEDGFNPKLNLAYEFDRDRMVYVQAAKGFRLGGTNEPVPAAACAAIGRASCRERVWQYGEVSVGAVSVTKKQNKKHR